jgi:hypothetical protein
MATLALTHAVAVAGIGNRPGALQMNSGFRWPYGRREGVLPVWAHRRASMPGAKLWQRVIFQNRNSEGFASRTSSDQSVDDYYCLSFDQETSGRDALDAVTCASVFSSDKGRFIVDRDVNNGYAEPWEDAQQRGSMRRLDKWSLYPPRRDVARCTAAGCYDHPDVDQFKSHALEVMPELDAITRATPAGEQFTKWSFSVPGDWDPSRGYKLYIEANVEGDYNPTFTSSVYKTPSNPDSAWDSWAISYGYPYRGQPSVVFEIPFRIDTPNEATANTPAGYGDLEGANGNLNPMTSAITDNPNAARGSGADRLLSMAGVRATLKFLQTDPCALDMPPPECGMTCLDNPTICGESLVCGADGTCQSVCAAQTAPPKVDALEVSEYPEATRAHMWSVLRFVVPHMDRPIGGFDVAVRARGGEWEQAFTHDLVEELLPVALDVCTDPNDLMRNRCPDLQGGEALSFDLTGLRQGTDYDVRVIVRDGLCNQSSEEAIASFRTPERVFTTVSPCFIATATYGSPLAQEIGALRAFRDRYLASHAPGRALIALYYEHGPELASWVRREPWLRSATRAILDPVVHVVEWWLR